MSQATATIELSKQVLGHAHQLELWAETMDGPRTVGSRSSRLLGSLEELVHLLERPSQEARQLCLSSPLDISSLFFLLGPFQD